MGEIEKSLSPARMGDGWVYWVELAGFDKPLAGLADRRGIDELEQAFSLNDRAHLAFSGITIPGEKTSTGKPIHVGAALLSCPDTPCLIRYDDAFSGLPGGGDHGEDDDEDAGSSGPRDQGPRPIGGLGNLKRS